MTRTVDVIVVGAGPGGSVLAGDLARQGLSVMLIDKARFPRDKTCGDALSPGAVKILRELGQIDSLWHHGRRIDGLSVTMPQGTAVQAPFATTTDQTTPGYVIRRFDLDNQLCQFAVRAGAELVEGLRVTEVGDGGAGAPYVAGERDGRRFEARARTVVLAVGANLGLLRRIGMAPSQTTLSFAVRQYWSGTPDLGRMIQLRFDGVPLPGYGWIFPLSASSANVGVGVYGSATSAGKPLPAVLDEFLRHPAVAESLRSGGPEGPPKGFPLRTDFHRSRARRNRLLLIGEAVGLVNPFTGEGIDYALESALIASRAIQQSHLSGDFSAQGLAEYEHLLRDRFQRVFVLTSTMRRLYMNARVLGALGRACIRWPEVTRLFVDVLLTRKDPLQVFAPGVLWKLLRSLPAPA